MSRCKYGASICKRGVKYGVGCVMSGRGAHLVQGECNEVNRGRGRRLK